MGRGSRSRSGARARPVSEVTFCGEMFLLTDPGHYAMQDMLEIAESGTDTETFAGFHSITKFIAACMDEDDYARWESLARKHRSTGEDMIRIVMEGLTARPTVQPSDSSDGPSATVGSSTDASSLRVITRLQGRPDLQLMVLQAQEARAAS